MFRALLPSLAAASLCVSSACAQHAPVGAQQHDALVAALREAAPRPLPIGDTLLTWAKPGLVLFHTVQVTPSHIETALLRNDRMLGTATGEWEGATWMAARGEWRAGDFVTLAWSAQRAPGGLRLRARRDTLVALPTLPWAVADYGMDDQLVPLLRALPGTGAQAQLAVFRPFAARWDTLTVTARDTAGVRVVTLVERGEAREVWALLSSGGIVAARQSTGAERRPLDGSPAFVRWHQHMLTLQRVGAAAR